MDTSHRTIEQQIFGYGINVISSWCTMCQNRYHHLHQICRSCCSRAGRVETNNEKQDNNATMTFYDNYVYVTGQKWINFILVNDGFWLTRLRGSWWSFWFWIMLMFLVPTSGKGLSLWFSRIPLVNSLRMQFWYGCGDHYVPEQVPDLAWDVC